MEEHEKTTKGKKAYLTTVTALEAISIYHYTSNFCIETAVVTDYGSQST